MPPIGRLLGIAAGFAVSYAAQHGLTLNETEVLAIFMSVYSGVHSIYRHYADKKKLGT